MGAKRKSFTPQYRRDAAHLVIDSGRTIAAVASEIGICSQPRTGMAWAVPIW